MLLPFAFPYVPGHNWVYLLVVYEVYHTIHIYIHFFCRCSFCNKGFSTNFYLKQHERIHNGQKPYKCPMCEQSFKQLSHVQQHVRTHTGVRPYKCNWPGCGKAFLQQSHLKSHIARHSPKYCGQQSPVCYNFLTALLCFV